MRRYDVVSEILFILSIIGFALAAPVLVQEKRQACVGVVHIPKDVITVLGKRVDEELERLAEEYFKSIKKSVESSDPPNTLTLARPGYDHGSTSAVDWNLWMESSGSAATPPMEGSWADRFNAAWDDVFSNKGDEELHGPLHPPTSTEHSLDHELTGVHAPQGNPQKRPLTDWNDLMNYNYPRPPTQRPAPQEEFGQADKNQVEHVQQPNPGLSTDSDSNFDWKQLKLNNLEVKQLQRLLAAPSKSHGDPAPSRPAPPKEFGQTHENQVEHVQQPNPGTLTDSLPEFDWNHDWNHIGR